eukprot:scaffold58105_cov44-Attheya_sp.AAC.1
MADNGAGFLFSPGCHAMTGPRCRGQRQVPRQFLFHTLQFSQEGIRMGPPSFYFGRLPKGMRLV